MRRIASYRPCKHFCKKSGWIIPGAGRRRIASVILTWWKLRDEIEDSHLVRAAGCRLLSLLTRRAYRKAARKRPGLARTVRMRCFPAAMEEKTACRWIARRTLCRLYRGSREACARNGSAYSSPNAYQLGRWIYLIDALDDLQDDAARGRYNPLLYRYGLQNGQISGEDQSGCCHADHSVRLIASALALKNLRPGQRFLKISSTMGFR